MAVLTSGLETHPTGTGNPNDIINNNWVLIDALFVTSTPYAPSGLDNLIGGGGNDLDGVDVSHWAVNSFVFTFVTDNTPGATGKRFRVYYFRAMVGTELEDGPSLIVSDDDPTKVFELLA